MLRQKAWGLFMRSDARIQDIRHTLSDPEDFVRGILENFINEGFNRDEAVVRIGISGTGAAPHYCIEHGSKTVALLPGLSPEGYRQRAVFHGRSHNPILDDQSKGISWSSAAMTFAEVQDILGSLRAGAVTPRGPKPRNVPPT
jgi:hypothetical protein